MSTGQRRKPGRKKAASTWWKIATKYKNRFRDFSNSFFHKIVAVQSYPLESADQGISYLFDDTGIQFLTLNSAWQIDQFNRDRSGIHPEAVLNAVSHADKLRNSPPSKAGE